MGKLNVVIPATNVIVEGVEYRKVDREAQAGDIVRITDEDAQHYSYITYDGFYKIVETDSSGDPLITDDDGDELDLFSWKYDVYGKVTKTPTNEEDNVESKPERLEVGEYAKVIEATVGYSKVGQIVKITMDDRTRAPFNTEGLDGTYTGWHYETGLVRATDEEVATAKASLKPEPKFNEGDTVKLVSLAGGILHGFNVGDIVTVVHNPHGADDVHYLVQKAEGGTGYASKSGGLAPLSEEELAQEALAAKWSAIGRKMGELKVGDLVRVTAGCGGHANGTIGECNGISHGVFPECHYYVTANGKRFSGAAELVTPVEQRFDRVG